MTGRLSACRRSERKKDGTLATTKGLVITVSIALVWVCMLLWLILPMSNAARVGSNPLFPFVLAPFALLPMYPLYWLAKKWPRFSLGILGVAACLLVTLAAGFLYYVLHFDNLWVERLFDLSQILCAVSSLLLVWQATRRHG